MRGTLHVAINLLLYSQALGNQTELNVQNGLTESMQVGTIAAVKPGTFGRWSQNLQGMGPLVILIPEQSSKGTEAAGRIETSITTHEYIELEPRARKCILRNFTGRYKRCYCGDELMACRLHFKLIIASNQTQRVFGSNISGQCPESSCSALILS